jgi:hypothetical protein
VSTTAEITKALGENKKKGKPYKIICIGDSGGASSTKEATAEGHKVTTMAEGAVATAAAPAEPGGEGEQPAAAIGEAGGREGAGGSGSEDAAATSEADETLAKIAEEAERNRIFHERLR